LFYPSRVTDSSSIENRDRQQADWGIVVFAD
jgi:hypothetical protein